MREPEDTHGLGADGAQAFENRDALLYERGGLQKLESRYLIKVDVIRCE